MSIKNRMWPFKAVCILILTLVTFPACTRRANEESPGKIIVADAKTTHHLNLYVAQELGFFEKQGLSVNIVSVVDNAASRDLVISGQADVFWSCPTVAIAAIANGAPLRMIAQVKTPCTSVLVVPPNSPIRSYADLNGKNIGGISPTCEAVISLAVMARRAGGAFVLERLAGGPALAALEAGKLDGVILEEPHVSIAELRGFKTLFQEASSNIPCRTINVRTAFLRNNADNLKRFIAAIDEANAVILADPVAPRIVEIAVQYTGAPPEAVIHGNYRLKFQTQLEQEGLYKLADELIALNNIRENPRQRLFANEFRNITWK